MPRDFDPHTGEGAQTRGAGAEKPGFDVATGKFTGTGMKVGDVLRHKSASSETTTEWAKRISSQARAERRGRERARAGDQNAYEAGLADEYLARGGHEGKTDEQVAEEIHREHYRYAYADLFDYAESDEDSEWAEQQASAQADLDMATLTAAVKRVRAELKGKKPGSKMSRRSGHDLLIEARVEAVERDPKLRETLREAINPRATAMGAQGMVKAHDEYQVRQMTRLGVQRRGRLVSVDTAPGASGTGTRSSTRATGSVSSAKCSGKCPGSSGTLSTCRMG